MNDYKELIADLRSWFYDVEIVLDAANAIEQLVNDRNASVDALKAIEDAIYNYGGLKGGDE